VETLAARQIRVGNFVQISRMALALCFALIGGYLGRAFNERQRGLTGQGPPVTS
jgi:predicted Zn-dependent protease with MMP-like domain